MILKLEAKIKKYSAEELKSELCLSCACGKSFKQKERFSNQTAKYTRYVSCPRCKESSLAHHSIALYDDNISYKIFIAYPNNNKLCIKGEFNFKLN